MPKLTNRLIQSTPRPKAGETVLMDDELKGFGLRLWPGGRCAFFVRYRFGGRQYRLALGPLPLLTLEEARAQARQVLARVARGDNPAVRDALPVPVMVAELATRYLDEHAVPKLKPATVRLYRQALQHYLVPALGALSCAAVTPQDVSALHAAMRSTPAMANRTIELCGTLFTLAERWGLRPRHSNPATGLKKYPEHPRERFLTAAELAQLGRTLAMAEQTGTETPAVVAVIRLLLFTACRVGEILTLEWSQIDLARHTARLIDAKTGPRTLYLAEPAVAVLRTLPRHSARWVFPGMRPGRPLGRIKHPWARLRDQAGIPDVRLHDLRHTYASLAVQAGLSLPLIGALLGHSEPKTTQRYSHWADEPVHKASNMIGELIDQLLRA